MDFINPKLLLILEWEVFGHELVFDFGLFFKLFLQLVFLIFLTNLNFLQPLNRFFFVDVHLKFVTGDHIPNIIFFFLKFFGFVLHFLQVLLYLVCPLQFIFDDFVTCCDSCLISLDVSLGHFAFTDVIFFCVEMLGEVGVENLRLIMVLLGFDF